MAKAHFKMGFVKVKVGFLKKIK